MSRHDTVMAIVTERVIHALEMGEVPWERPWCSVTGGAYNRISGRRYSLLNQLILTHAGEYASWKQWTKLGGTIREDEKERSEIVVFWKMPEVNDRESENEEETQKEQQQRWPLLRYHRVYHISQVDNVASAEPVPVYIHEPLPAAEKLLKEYTSREGVHVLEDFSDQAFYSPVTDSIHIPKREQFKHTEFFYSTAFHEMIHSSGVGKRLNRFSEENFHYRSRAYSMEELCAEIGSSAIMNYLHLETDHSIRNSTGYIQGWLKALRNDKRMICFAAGQAEKAVSYILKTE